MWPVKDILWRSPKNLLVERGIFRILTSQTLSSANIVRMGIDCEYLSNFIIGMMYFVWFFSKTSVYLCESVNKKISSTSWCLWVSQNSKTPIPNGSNFYSVTVLTMHFWPFLCYVLLKPLDKAECPTFASHSPIISLQNPLKKTYPPKSADVLYGWYLSRLENLQSQVNLFNVAIQRAFLGQQFATVRTNYAFNIWMEFLEVTYNIFLCKKVLFN